MTLRTCATRSTYTHSSFIFIPLSYIMRKQTIYIFNQNLTIPTVGSSKKKIGVLLQEPVKTVQQDIRSMPSPNLSPIL